MRYIICPVGMRDNSRRMEANPRVRPATRRAPTAPSSLGAANFQEILVAAQARQDPWTAATLHEPDPEHVPGGPGADARGRFTEVEPAPADGGLVRDAEQPQVQAVVLHPMEEILPPIDRWRSSRLSLPESLEVKILYEGTEEQAEARALTLALEYPAYTWGVFVLGNMYEISPDRRPDVLRRTTNEAGETLTTGVL